mmetsp:Transcript_30661/g.99712  ORF Transcript_30661/g.99712 Transcript_30661/m.99712 type:complete len:222 (+) Transcript_30661:176-841(+)
MDEALPLLHALLLHVFCECDIGQHEGYVGGDGARWRGADSLPDCVRGAPGIAGVRRDVFGDEHPHVPLAPLLPRPLRLHVLLRRLYIRAVSERGGAAADRFVQRADERFTGGRLGRGGCSPELDLDTVLRLCGAVGRRGTVAPLLGLRQRAHAHGGGARAVPSFRDWGEHCAGSGGARAQAPTGGAAGLARGRGGVDGAAPGAHVHGGRVLLRHRGHALCD